MDSDFGYIEEGKLGKPYDFRLLKRLARYARPYRKTIAFALFLTILLTLVDLSLPYLSKIVIDRYILSTWKKIDVSSVDRQTDPVFSELRGRPILVGPEGSFIFVPHRHLLKMDPSVIYRLKSRGLISEKDFYQIAPSKVNRTLLAHWDIPVTELPGGALFVPMEAIRNLDAKDIGRIRQNDMQGAFKVAVVLIGLLLISFGLGFFAYYFLERTGQRVMQDIRLQLFGIIQSQSLHFFHKNPVGRLVTRVTNDVENLNEMFKSVLVTVFKDIFILIGILVVLITLNWRLALVSFILIPIIFGLTFSFSRMAREAFRELREKVAMLNSFIQERVAGMRMIQLFAIERSQMKQFTGINQAHFLAGMKQIRVFAVFMPIMELLASCAVALIIWYGGGKVISEQISLGSLVAFISYIRMFFRPIRDISEKYNIMQSAMASTERIFEFMDHEDIISESDHPHAPKNVAGALTFDDVSFGYNKNQGVLHHVSFEIKPGEMVAIVGPTGAGKTTLVNLIERFYDPDEGQILLDGKDIRLWSKEALRSHIGLVMQDVFIFAGTVAENISLDQKPERSQRVEEAASEANALAFIHQLPNRFDQEIGEMGATISAGERQLLSFARALAHNPAVLILDEATSSVDPNTEGLIQNAISRMTKQRTTLVIAHRLSTIRDADRILVMHQGTIHEQGTHEELMALKGIYYSLIRFRETEFAHEPADITPRKTLDKEV